MDRRRSRRLEVVFPLLCNPGTNAECTAISRNISRHGVLMATANQLEVGAEVEVVLRIGGKQRQVKGRIVRVDAPEAGETESSVAVNFAEPVEELDELLPAGDSDVPAAG